jgi:hypothetical protein
MENLLNNVLIIQDNYYEIVKDISKMKKSLPKISNVDNGNFPGFVYPINGKTINTLDSVHKVKLNPHDSGSFERPVFAYDESIRKFSCLEGDGYLTGHSLVHIEKNDYIPVGLISFYFYTRSKIIQESSSFIRFSTDIEMDSKRDYIRDRIKFLSDHTPENSILLIDGPLIAGDVYTYMIQSMKLFLDKNIIPVFFVKNSNSNMVSDAIETIRNQYNSDLHWAYEYLSQGERSNYFYYQDKINSKNAKVFCYIKAFNKSPQRIEFYVSTFEKHKNEIDKIIEQVYYYLLVQGPKNPQVRPIAIAELYAREYLSIVNFESVFMNSGLIPTMNQERFGG